MVRCLDVAETKFYLLSIVANVIVNGNWLGYANVMQK